MNCISTRDALAVFIFFELQKVNLHFNVWHNIPGFLMLCFFYFLFLLQLYGHFSFFVILYILQNEKKMYAEFLKKMYVFCFKYLSQWLTKELTCMVP